MNDCAQPCKCTACWWHIGFTNVVSPFGPDRFCVTRVVVLYFRRRTFTMSFYTAFVQVVTRRNQHTTCVWHTGFHKCHIVQRIYYILEITMWFHCVRMTHWSSDLYFVLWLYSLLDFRYAILHCAYVTGMFGNVFSWCVYAMFEALVQVILTCVC